MPWTKSTGNMYPWVDYCHSHLRGGCPHECDYCYTQHMRCKRFYEGPLTLKAEELKVNYGEENTIFVEHMNDLFAEKVPQKFVDDILDHCNRYPRNKYVFQTKNPYRPFEMLDQYDNYLSRLPDDCMIGTTIETNDEEILLSHSKAPAPIDRFVWITALRAMGLETFITIEPVMMFDSDILVNWIVEAQPVFVNIGADSKRCGLLEPSKADLQVLIEDLQTEGIEIREKHNLDRLLK